VIGGAQQRVEHVQLTDNVADVQQLDKDVQRDEVVAAMAAEHRKQQTRQHVLQTERPLGAELLNSTDWSIVGESAL